MGGEVEGVIKGVAGGEDIWEEVGEEGMQLAHAVLQRRPRQQQRLLAPAGGQVRLGGGKAGTQDGRLSSWQTLAVTKPISKAACSLGAASRPPPTHTIKRTPASHSLPPHSLNKAHGVRQLCLCILDAMPLIQHEEAPPQRAPQRLRPVLALYHVVPADRICTAGQDLCCRAGGVQQARAKQAVQQAPSGRIHE